MPRTMPTPERYSFPALTGIRAVAAWMVFVHHFNPFDKETLPGSLLEEFHIGVSIFFVLSGFLITIRYQESIRSKSLSITSYLQNRYSRIYPLFFLLVTLDYVLPFLTGAEPFPVGMYLLNITFLKAFFGAFLFAGMPQGWTLTVEWTFYLLAPVIFFSRRISFFIQPLLLVLLGSILVLSFRNIEWYGFFESFQMMMVYTFFGRCFEFYAGVYLARKFLKGALTSGGKAGTYGGTAFILIMIVLMSVVPGSEPSGLSHPVGIFLNNFMLPIGIAIFFYGLIREQTFIGQMLSGKIFNILGKSAYAFYLIHLGAIQVMVLKLVSDNVFLLFVVLQVIAVVLYRVVEQPINRWWRSNPTE